MWEPTHGCDVKKDRRFNSFQFPNFPKDTTGNDDFSAFTSR